MGKTYKDIKKFDVKQHKRNAREVFNEIDLRTRVKPIEKKERGGARNWQDLLTFKEDEHIDND